MSYKISSSGNRESRLYNNGSTNNYLYIFDMKKKKNSPNKTVISAVVFRVPRLSRKQIVIKFTFEMYKCSHGNRSSKHTNSADDTRKDFQISYSSRNRLETFVVFRHDLLRSETGALRTWDCGAQRFYIVIGLEFE